LSQDAVLISFCKNTNTSIKDALDFTWSQILAALKALNELEQFKKQEPPTPLGTQNKDPEVIRQKLLKIQEKKKTNKMSLSELLKGLQ